MKDKAEIYKKKIEEELEELSRMLEDVKYVDEKQLVGTLGALATYMEASELFKKTLTSQVDEIARRIHQYFETQKYSELEGTLKDLKKLVSDLKEEMKRRYKKRNIKLLVLLFFLTPFFFLPAFSSVTSKAALSISSISLVFLPIILLILIKVLRGRG